MNEFPAVDREGFLLLSGQPNAFVNVNSRAPFTRLHLIDQAGNVDPTVYAQQHGYRPWMRNGITFTGNSDQSYIGHKYAGDDNTDFVIQWSDNPSGSPWGIDRLKFVFSSQYTGSHSGMGSMSGMEAMRFWPKNGFEVNVGIGDFAPPAMGDPTERLDILSGRVRIRQLPTSRPADSLTKVLVVDDLDPSSDEYGVVKWREINTLSDACASGWTMNGNDPVTAYDGNTCPPQSIDRVGIGTDKPEAKLHVVKNVSNEMPTERAVHAMNTVAATNAIGVDAEARGTGSINYALRSKAENAARNFGLWSEAIGIGSQLARGIYTYASGETPMGIQARVFGSNAATAVQAEVVGGATSNLGVRASVMVTETAHNNYGLRAAVQATNAASVNYGVYASVIAPVTATRWAGWFQGKVWVTDSAWVQNGVVVISDGNLKTDVQDLTGSLEKVLQLAPKTYVFDPGVHPELQLPTAPQIGMIAQELEEVIPQAVGTTTYPAQFDTLGNMISDGFSIKGIDYLKLVPVLVGAIKEQQARIAVQDERLAQLEQALAACCAAGATTAPNEVFDGDGIKALDPALERLLLIAPNPFTDQTTVYYTLERHGRAQLLVNSADGRHIQVLHEGNLPAGEHRYDWSTAHLAPGVHYVTLLLDGEPVVKRAVKVR